MLQFEANKKENASDRACPHCLRYNPEGAVNCRFCGQCCNQAPSHHHLKRGNPGPADSNAAAVSTGVGSAARGSITGLCLRNRTTQNLWLYTEQTAPLEWVQLRPGECCDMPTGRVWYTIGASFDQPSPTAAILGQLGFAATILAAVVLCILPEPASKAAVIAYIAGALATAGGLTAGSAILGVSNQSNMKRTGVLADGAVWDIVSTLQSYTTLVTGERIAVYHYFWEQAAADWDHRRQEFEAVDIRQSRNLDTLKPVEGQALKNIIAAAKASQQYIKKIDEWYKHGVLDQHVFPLGGDAVSWNQSTFSPPAIADGRKGLITGVRVAACKFIDAVQVKYAGKTEWEPACGSASARNLGIFQSPQLRPDDHLGYGGELICAQDDFIEKITVCYDKYVCRIDFETRKGVTRVFGGRDGDGAKTMVLGSPYTGRANGYGWIGFKLEGDAWVDRMTFLMEKLKEA
jgi:hypothetical protein